MQLFLCFIVMQNIQIFYEGPIMFVVICCFCFLWLAMEFKSFPVLRNS